MMISLEDYSEIIKEYDFEKLLNELLNLQKSIQKYKSSKSNKLSTYIDPSPNVIDEMEQDYVEVIRRQLIDKYPKDYLASLKPSELRTEIVNFIDRTIKKTWKKNIVDDYSEGYLLREDSLKCSFYYHLRRQLNFLMKQYNIYIYPEFYIKELQYRADIAIVQMDFSKNVKDMRNAAKDILAVLELKFVSEKSQKTIEAIKHDISKMKNYNTVYPNAQYYCALIYEAEIPEFKLIDKRSTNNWADGKLTLLQADIQADYLCFEIKNNCNHLNMDINSF